MRRLGTIAVAVATVLALGLMTAGAADAHVTVSAPGATRGGSDQEITFRVPVEKQVATVGFALELPTDTPLASVDVEPFPGWTHVQTSSRLPKPITTDDGTITSAVTRIVWTATAQGLKPGEFGAFTILAGQLPDARQLVFRALQTYSDGSVVRWIQTAAPGSTDEPDFPAPVLSLASDSITAAQPRAAASGGPSNTGPVVLSIVALVLAAAALGVSVVSRARRRSEP